MKKMMLAYEIKKISHLIRGQLQLSAVTCADLTLPQMEIILFAQNCDGGVFQKDIEKYFDVKRSTVSLLLNNMEKKQLITRVAVKDDARLKKITLTQKARELANSVHDELLGFEEMLSVGITQEEFETLVIVFEKIRKNLNGGADIGRKQKGNI